MVAACSLNTGPTYVGEISGGYGSSMFTKHRVARTGLPPHTRSCTCLRGGAVLRHAYTNAHRVRSLLGTHEEILSAAGAAFRYPHSSC